MSADNPQEMIDPLIRAIRVLIFGKPEYWSRAADQVLNSLEEPKVKKNMDRSRCVCGSTNLYKKSLCMPCTLDVRANEFSTLPNAASMLETLTEEVK